MVMLKTRRDKDNAETQSAQRFRRERREERNGMRRTRKMTSLEDFFLAAQIAEGADIGDGKRDAELILSAYLAEGDAAVFEGEAAAVAVVSDLGDLVLKRGVLKIVADAAGEIKTFAVEAAVADQCANLVGERLQHGVVLNVKVGDSSEKFAVWPH